MKRKRHPIAKLLDPKFKYVTAQESRAPGYLADKFARIAAEMKASKLATPPENVSQLKRKSKEK